MNKAPEYLPTRRTPNAVRLTVDLDRHGQLRPRVEKIIGAALPEPGRAAGGDPLLLWQGPRDWLLLCETVDAETLAQEIRTAAPDASLLVNAVRGGVSEFIIDAPEARTMLAGGTAIDLDPDYFADGAVTVTRFAQNRVTLHRFGGAYRLIAERPVANHISLWLQQAAANASA